MSTKTKETSSRREVSDSDKSFSNLFSELGRHQLALVVEGTSALCRSSEALRKIQQDAAHEASVFHEETAQKLFTPCQPADLMAIQSELMRFCLQSSGKYWQQLVAQAMQTQVEMMRSVSQVLKIEKDTGMKSPLEVLQAAMPPLASSLFPMTAHVPDGQAWHS
ncbi:phasin family protein [Polaromonas hydrogenivorans]|uniref:Phasin family protein n=1 Tax=Polaromonas hydrogenivorans TaxID=335476 RepID=A0AAU7LLP4_9BURK